MSTKPSKEVKAEIKASPLTGSISNTRAGEMVTKGRKSTFVPFREDPDDPRSPVIYTNNIMASCDEGEELPEVLSAERLALARQVFPKLQVVEGADYILRGEITEFEDGTTKGKYSPIPPKLSY